ncbi:putative TIR domain-containing protein [Helianthus annuus]|nr:putative TIR domain-containing protein [Helianthus annuus]
MASTSASSSIQKTFKYDVLLSFRGEDTLTTFVDPLFHALQQKGIITYKDDESIEKGERSIEYSRFHIIVFSKNYASSSWCLDELVKIMECQKMTEYTAYPIFYDLEPTEVRNQSGAVGKAFAKHVRGSWSFVVLLSSIFSFLEACCNGFSCEKEDNVGRWRDALKEAASLTGMELKNTFNGCEAKYIQQIVEEVSRKLQFFNLSVDRTLVGRETQVIGGGGETTLARNICDHTSIRFEGESSVGKRFKYDVFLSFRGEDTRKTFVDHLYHALHNRGIKDDEKIQKGKRINDQLMRSIEDSRIYIIVFFKNYASSSWCLDELVKIMECHKTTGRTAYPVFFNVEPREVRHQSGAVGEAFAKHEKKDAAGIWRDAMKEAADLAWERVEDYF